jgi:hypothetical protein
MVCDAQGMLCHKLIPHMVHTVPLLKKIQYLGTYYPAPLRFTTRSIIFYYTNTAQFGRQILSTHFILFHLMTDPEQQETLVMIFSSVVGKSEEFIALL